MLDENLKVPKEEAKIYPPIPKNVYQVQLLDITLKDAVGKFAKPGEKVFVFQFTLLAGKDGENDLRGRNIWNNFVPTALYIGKNGKNALYQIVEAIQKREITQEEEAEGLTGAFLNTLIGKQLKIFVDHKAKKDGNGVWDTITSYMPVEAELTLLSDDEKEEARVKVNDDKKEQQTQEEPETGGHVEEPPTDMDIAVDNLPFE